MALHLAEIIPGAVAYLDVMVLLDDERIVLDEKRFKDYQGRGLRPFVCVQQREGFSVWAPLTTEYRRERLPIEPAWRLGGPPNWQSETTYLNDGANTCRGPNEAFVDAAADEWAFAKCRRRSISLDGMQRVLEMIIARGGRMLAEEPAALT